MPAKSTIETHPDREAIEMAILRGESVRNVAARFGLSSTAVQRHKVKLPVSMAKVQEFRDEEAGSRLVRDVRNLTNRALNILAEAEIDGDRRSALGAIREARRCLELIGKATGEIEPQQVNVTHSLSGLLQSIEDRRDQAMRDVTPGSASVEHHPAAAD